MTNQKESNTIINILWTILFTGIFISTINFFYNRSLWGDEAMLSLNISEKTFFQLFKPLEMNQVAPVGFLITEKLFIILFGIHDWALRIYPFLSFLFSIILLFKINQKLFESTIISLTSCILFITNLSIFYYSNEVKQYSSDVFVSLLLIYTFISNSGLKSKKEILLTSLTGMFAVFFSNTSIIILFSLSGIVLYNFIKERGKIAAKTFLPLLTWFLSFSIYFVCFIKDHPAKSFMINYWSARKAFPPNNIFAPEFRLFLFRKAKMLFSSYSEFSNSWLILFVLFVMGIYFIYKKEKQFLLLIAPLPIHFILSIFNQYPFETRMLLYTIPMISTFISFGLFSTQNLINKKFKNKAGIVMLLPAIFLIISLSFACPVKKEEIKPCMQFVNQHISQGENIYVYYMANPAFQFYKNEYSSVSKSTSVVIGNWHIHGCGKSFMSLESSNIKSINYNELFNIHGNFWIIFTGISSSSYFKINNLTEDDYIVSSFIKNGYSVFKSKSFAGSSCYQLISKK